MSISKLTLPNGELRWEARYYLNGRDSRRMAKRFKKYAEAEAFLKKHLAKRDDLLTDDSDTILIEAPTFKQAAENWIKSNDYRFSRSHFFSVERFVKKISENWGHVKLSKFDPSVLSQIQSELLKSGLKTSSVNRHMQAVIAIINWALKQNQIKRNPSSGFQKLKEVRDAVGFWEKQEAESFLECMYRRYPPGSPRRWVYVVYLLALNTAARAGEIWGLWPSDIEPNSEVILVQRQFNKTTADFSPTKGKSNRRLPCNSELYSEIKALIERRAIQPNETIFMNRHRGPLCHNNFSNRFFEKDMKAWGGRRIRFHDLRHTATTLMMASGVDLRTVQEICGHQDIKTTMNYVHLLSERVRETARSFSILPSLSVKPNERLKLQPDSA